MKICSVVITQKSEGNKILKTKIINGSTLSIGNNVKETQITVDQHFNWFQKLMWKLCFGVKVDNYEEIKNNYH